MEQYLKDQYNVREISYLKSEDDIVPYFMEDPYDYFDCGQGYYEDEVEVIVKIKDKFYSVKITAEIGSSKQDRGDRLYFVEGAESVEYKEIEKPVDKNVDKIKYLLFESNFDEGESEVYKLCSIESIKDFFFGEEEVLGHLLESGTYYGKLYQYHLIYLADFK